MTLVTYSNNGVIVTFQVTSPLNNENRQTAPQHKVLYYKGKESFSMSPLYFAIRSGYLPWIPAMEFWERIFQFIDFITRGKESIRWNLMMISKVKMVCAASCTFDKLRNVS